MTDELLYFISNRVTVEASGKSEDAGHNGRWDDGGASGMRSQLEAYCDGYNKEIPKEWMKYVKDFNHNKDPEFEIYQRLKKKFGET